MSDYERMDAFEFRNVLNALSSDIQKITQKHNQNLDKIDDEFHSLQEKIKIDTESLDDRTSMLTSEIKALQEKIFKLLKREYAALAESELKSYIESSWQTGIIQPNPRELDEAQLKLKSLYSKKRFADRVKPRSLQSEYSQLVNRFARDQAFSGKKDESGKWSPEVSNFTYSLYKIYRDQLSKDNRSTDIIHLKADQTGILQFNIAKGYYRLTTPESDEQVWQGDILSVDNAVKTSVLSVKSPMGQSDITFHNSAERLDVRKELSYDFPIYLAKLDNSWIAGNKPVFIARPRGIPFIVKNGATAYPLSMTGRQSYYMVLQSDDCIETERNEHVGNQGGNIYVRGDVNKYFARNMLVNGRRTLVYPLGEKFFYPYHVANIAKATYSGEDENRRKTDVLLSLSYSMTEDIYNNMS